MVVPQALEQLLQRPEALSLAAKTAVSGDDQRLWRIVREAMRFDPLAPTLPRVATSATALIAKGRNRATTIPQGANVVVAFSSAMKDDRRLRSPKTFDADRLDHEYIHFGHGLHECFGKVLNASTLPRILKPLLRCSGLRRADGADGQLAKNGIFAEHLVVHFDE